MCEFITATLPKDAELALCREIFDRHKLGFEEIENFSVRESLETGDYYISTTRGRCDCGTVLGSEAEGDKPDSAETAKYEIAAIEKLEKKGWSQARIERWLKERRLANDKDKRGQAAGHESRLVFASDWIEFITDILTSNAASRLGLLVRSYTGSLSERVVLKGKLRASLEELTPTILLRMEDDTIYEFVLR